MIFIALKRTVILCSTTKRPGATPDHNLLALLNVFHPKVAPKQAPCCTERRHVCYYLITDATWPFTWRFNTQAVMGYVVCFPVYVGKLVSCISFVYFSLPQPIMRHFYQQCNRPNKQPKKLTIFVFQCSAFYLWPKGSLKLYEK